MEQSFKYKVILKIKRTEGLPPLVGPICASCEITGCDEVLSGTITPQDGQVSWERQNVLAKLTLPYKDKEEAVIRLKEDKKKKSLAKLRIDLADYAIKVQPGETTKFPIEKRLKSGINVFLSMAMKRDLSKAGSSTPELSSKNKVGVRESSKSLGKIPAQRSSTSTTPTKPPRKALYLNVRNNGEDEVTSSSCNESTNKSELSKSTSYRPRKLKINHLNDEEGKTKTAPAELRRDIHNSPTTTKVAELKSNTLPNGVLRAFTDKRKRVNLTDITEKEFRIKSHSPTLPMRQKPEIFDKRRSLKDYSSSRRMLARAHPSERRIERGKSTEDCQVPMMSLTDSSTLRNSPRNSPGKTDTKEESNSTPSSSRSPRNAQRLVQDLSSPFSRSHDGSNSGSRRTTLTTSGELPDTPPSTASRKYPSFGSSRPRLSSHNNGKKGNNNSDRNQVNSGISLSSSGTDVASWKQQYAEQQQLADEKFLTENIIGNISDPNLEHVHVIGYIIFKSLNHWDAFDKNGGIHTRVVDSCERAMKESQDSRMRCFQWLSTFFTLSALMEEYIKSNPFSEKEISINIAEFQGQLRGLISSAFELVLNNLYKRMEPILKSSFNEAINTQVNNIVQVDNSSGPLELLFNRLQDYLQLSIEYCLFDGIRKHFFRRIYKFLAVALLDALVQEGSSYGQGIQLKMILTKLEEWARHKAGPDIGIIAEEELEVVRQAANVLCLLQKGDLAKEEFRIAVCPHLRPKHILHILKGYRPDHFDKEAVPPSLLEQLKLQDEKFQPTPRTFDPQDLPPLKIDFEFPVLDLDNIKLPKVVLDRPGFAFLKNINSARNSNDSKDDTLGQW